MPAFDGTGPNGNGPMTGWSRGMCANRGFGPRWGAGRRGFCNVFGRRTPRTDDREWIAEEIQAVTEYLEDLRAQEKELHKT